jgi:outer membrane protein OmpA-like peptidoglycan-associated protein
LGTEEHNQKLSERRANTVREILIAGNIAPKRLKAIGYGEARPAMFEPIPENIDSTEAASNRRVLFEIIVK